MTIFIKKKKINKNKKKTYIKVQIFLDELLSCWMSNTKVIGQNRLKFSMRRQQQKFSMMRRRDQLRAFCELEVNIVIKSFIQKGNDKR